MRGKRLDKLLELFAQNESDTFLLYALGMEYSGLNEKDQASSFFRRCLVQDENYIPAYYQLGLLLREAQQETEALELLKKGLEIVSKTGDLKTQNEFKSLIQEIEF